MTAPSYSSTTGVALGGQTFDGSTGGTPPGTAYGGGETSNSFSSNVVPMSVSTAAPGLFTQNGSGSGPGAILNHDYTPNGVANPAAGGASRFSTRQARVRPTRRAWIGQIIDSVLKNRVAPVVV